MADSNTSAPAGRPSRRVDGKQAAVLAMAAGMAALAGVLGAHLLSQGPRLHVLTLPWWVLAAGFWATEELSVQVHANGESQTVALSDVLVLLGLFLAPPAGVLAGWLVGSVVFMGRRRNPLPRTLWNLALCSLETVTAFAVSGWVGGSTGFGPRAWLGAALGILALNLLSGAAVEVVMALHAPEPAVRPLLRALYRTARAELPRCAVVATVGLVAVSSVIAAPATVWLLLVAGAGAVVWHRRYAAAVSRQVDLERLLRLSQVTSQSPAVEELLRATLVEARDVAHGEQSEIVLSSSDGQVTGVRLLRDGRVEELPAGEGQPGWVLSAVLRAGTPQLLPRGTRHAEGRRWLEARGSRDAVAVPLCGDAGAFGVLVVTDRVGMARSFNRQDLQLLQTIAGQLSGALRNAEHVAGLRREADHDPLTGLPNRSQLQRRLTAALGAGADGPSGTAVLLLDLDGFKLVNDTLGHHQGDLLLTEVASRLAAAVGSDGIAARLGGDEFAVLLPDCPTPERAVDVGLRALAAIQEPVDLDGTSTRIGSSLGVALAPLHATDPARLLQCADVAMYDAKSTGAGLRVYEPRGRPTTTADRRAGGRPLRLEDRSSL